MAQKPLHMTYLPDMEDIGSEIMDKTLSAMSAYDYDKYTVTDVRCAIGAAARTPEHLAALLSPAAAPLLEEMAQKAQDETRLHFGNSRYLFTPLYISNYCENHCIYCGFNCNNQIQRARLDMDDIEGEMRAIASTGLEEILLLTGESPSMSDVRYIGEACKTARRYFKVIGLEVYPVDSPDYAYLRGCGADFITVFQETYACDEYARLHPGGRKHIFPYRFNAQERAVRGGIRGVGFGALLGLSNFRTDAFATGLHAYWLQRKYPHTEFSFSVPRLRPIINNSQINPRDVGEAQLMQVIAAYRLFMPFAGITISSRENARFRDNVVKIAATKISVGVNVGIGGHAGGVKGDKQFEIDDGRSASEIDKMLREAALQPVMSDYIYV